MTIEAQRPVKLPEVLIESGEPTEPEISAKLAAGQLGHDSESLLEILAPDNRFISAIVDCGNRLRALSEEASMPFNGIAKLLGDRKQLAKIASVCFWTSLAVEEGRAVRGLVCLCTPEQAPSNRRFATPCLLSQKSLVALLTASPETPLAVHCENDTPQIWGLLDIRPRFTVSLRVAGPGTLAAISDDDTLTVVHEGSVLDMQVGNKGENHTTRATGPLGLQILVAKLLGIERPFPDLFMLSSGLIMVICAMYRHRHGGAIAIVPADSDTWNASVEHRFAFDVSSSKRLHLRLQAVAAARVAADRSDIDINADLKVWNELNMRNEQRTCDEMLTNIGRLSAIDGVVVIRQDLTIVSFGAKLNCKPVDFSVMRLNAASVKHQDDCMITDLGGMRHQSAARFVHQHHDCMVVVSSQDGRLTLFAWVPDSDKVVEVGGLEHFLWGIDL